MTESQALQAEINQLLEHLGELRQGIARSFLGQEEVAELLLLSSLAGGHALLEGAPGLGKTTLVRGLANSLDLTFRRVQFTPDLMPADILGSRILETDQDGAHHFEFEPGPIFTHVLLADEINRATPRTQSALLEAMQEHQVTIHGKTHRLEEPFQVIATQNPIEMEGTYPLPEAQLDRFLVKIQLELPPREELARILLATTGLQNQGSTRSLDRKAVLRLRALVRELQASDDVVDRVAGIVHATHPQSELAPEPVRSFVRYGASPRAGQAILLVAKARALCAGRLHVSDEDIEAVARPCLRHRLILGYEADAAGARPDHLVDAVLGAVARAS